MGATGIYFNGTAADARAFMLHTLSRDILGTNEKLVDYSFAKDDTDNSTEIYCAVQNVQANVIGGLVVLYEFYKEDSEIIYRYYDECEFPYHCNCPQKILKRLSSVEDLANAFKWSEESRENAEKWRNACYFNLAEKNRRKALQQKIKKAVSIERLDAPFQIKTSVTTYHYYSLADFKISGKFIKTGTCNFNCSSSRDAKFFLQEFQKAFADGAAGYNTITCKPIKKSA